MSDKDTFRETLARRGSPHLLLYSDDPTRLRECLDGLPEKVFNVWRIEGSHLTTKEGALREFALKMRFPDYFGRNWDALRDCLGDLDWGDLDPVHQVVLIQDADSISRLGAKEAPILCRIFDDSASGYEHWETEWAYKVILQTESASSEALIAAIRVNDLEYANLALDG